MLRGVKGAAKAILGIDRASAALSMRRRAICDECPHAVPCNTRGTRACWCGKLWDGVRGINRTCGCYLAFKTKVRSEKCPLDAW